MPTAHLRCTVILSMIGMDARRQDPKRDLFRVTGLPHIATYTGLEVFPGQTEDGWVREGGEPFQAALEGQEFLLFRGLRSEEGVSPFAAAYGLLGLSSVAREQVGLKRHMRPAWARALTKPPDQYPARQEPVADWLRQAGLADLAVGLWGLLRIPQARRALVAAARAGRPVTETLSPLDLPELAASSSSWAVRSVLGGAAAAGLGCSVVNRGLDVPLEVHFHPLSWRAIYSRRAGREIRPAMRMELSTEGIGEFLLRHLVNPWIERVRSSLMVHEGLIVPATRHPVDLLGLLWIQLANALLSTVDPRVCAWERCPGPPVRPGVFLWRWGRTSTGTKHRDALYCHPRCQHAAAVHRSRQSPGHLQRRR